MQFLIELAKKIQSMDDTEFGKASRSTYYFMNEYEELGKKWLDHIEKLGIKTTDRDSYWHTTVREIRYWEEQELDYMYQRVMGLSRQILGKNQYFTVQTYSGKGTVPDRITILNRLVELSSKLLSELYPSILHLVHYKIDDVEINTISIRGNIDWNKTLLNAIKTSGGTPTSFVCNVPKRSFSTPENLLLHIAVTWIFNDAVHLSNFQKIDKISKEDKKIIWKILNSSRHILDSSLLTEIKKESDILQSFSRPTPKIKPTLNLIEKTLKNSGNTQSAYLQLITWMRQYLDFNVNRYHDLTNFTFENLEDFDTMFELWILFEYVNYLKKNHHVVANPIIIEKSLKGFQIEKDGKEFFIMYEKPYAVPIGKNPGLENPQNYRKPDFTIEFGSNCICGHSEKKHEHKTCSVTESDVACACKKYQLPVPIVMDAKNWRNMNRIDAVQKMGWYLTLMNKYQSSTGVLFFSNYEKNQDTSNPMTNQWGPIPINQGEWEFINYVVKSSRKSTYIEQLHSVFEQICSKITVLN